MPKKKAPDEAQGLSPQDPRRPLKTQRLIRERERIAEFQARAPQLNDPEFEEWEGTVTSLLRELLGASEALLRFRRLRIRPINHFMGGHREWSSEPREAWETGLQHADKILVEAIEELTIDAPHSTAGVDDPARVHTNKVFVVHGHDEASRETVARFLEKLGVEAVILHEQATEGRTIVEKLEHYADVDFAVVLLTPDDIGAQADNGDHLSPRARQNVVLELGFFVGKLGRKHVCALHKGPLELPSDYLGVGYVPLDAGGGWRLQLAKELRTAGFAVDMNQAL
jgi:predicted nucleotide-binding protein